jgi:ABC-type phosphate transport system substrate-binding protein
MTRLHLLRTLSVAALSAGLAPTVANAQAIINGGGATATQFDYAGSNNPTTGAPRSEFSTYNAAQTAVQFGTYWGSGSGTGQKAFIVDDLTCDIDGTTGANSGSCVGPAGGAGNIVHYGVSDNPLSAAQISTWATSSVGQSAAGDLIQLPAVGTGVAIPVVNSAVTKNGKFLLSDNDLCGVFSGLITNWSQITDSRTKPAAGVITVTYRSDSSGTTFLLVNHLAAVCNSTNTAAGVTFTGTTTFATLFPGNNSGGLITGGPLFATSKGEKGSGGVANYMSGLSNGAVTSAIGYLAPDWTSEVTGSGETLSNGAQPALIVAALTGSGTTASLPSAANIRTGLENPGAGSTNTTPPATAAEGANPALWVPVVPVVTSGYPVVGYATYDFAQCYATPAISAGLIGFLKDHYSSATYKAIQTKNGLVPLTNTPSAKFVTTIEDHILANDKPGWNTNIGNTTACAGLAGR